MKHFALIGHPVAHSLSPTIHRAFGKQLGIALEYRLIDVAADHFEQAVAEFAASGGSGINITLPHKKAAQALCEKLTKRAQRAGAVNTLSRTPTGWEGDNTDGQGLLRDLTERHGADLRGRRTLLLGAGGAAHGVAPMLLDAGIDTLWIVNRTPESADRLADRLGEPSRVHTRYWHDLPNLGVFDLVVNATSANRDSTKLDLPFSLTTNRTLAVHLSYGEAAIPFMSWARAAGCAQVVDGLGMLVEQAAEAFLRWHGTRPETHEIYQQLRAQEVALHTGD